MSALARFASGSIASWAKIGVTLGTQILLVPIYLHYWSVDQYGCWLAVQTLQGMLTIWTLGHSNYVGYEMLKLDPKDAVSFTRLLSSTIPAALTISTIELLIMVGLAATSGIRFLVDSNNSLAPELIHKSGMAVVVLGTVGLLVISWSGIFGRAVAPLGYFPRRAWWDVWLALFVACANVATVIAGGDVFATAITQALATAAFSIPMQRDFLRILERHEIKLSRPDLRLGILNALKSLTGAAKSGLEMMRQQGTRLIISSMVTVSAMVAFSTMRTASNVILQGVSTITWPIMPELNRYIREREHQKTWATLGFMWLMLSILMGPAIVCLQVFVPSLFDLWTHGKVLFDPVVFGLFSMSLLIYSTAQPAMAVLQGQNLLKLQFFITLATAIVMLTGMVLLVGKIGLKGAGASIVASELLGLILYFYFAAQWYGRNGLMWPFSMALASVASTFVASVSVMAICVFYHYRFYILAATLVTQAGLCFWFWWQLPAMARERIDRLLSQAISRIFTSSP